MEAKRRRSDRAGRGKLGSLGRPGTGLREVRRQFWRAVARGAMSEMAAVEVGVAPAVGVRWFRVTGGMPPTHLAPSAPPVSGRYLSFTEREQLALLRAAGHGVRECARRLGRSPPTVSRELRRNAATRGGRLDYRATTAQWHADRAARRPKAAKLATHARLRQYGQDRLAGAVATADGVPVPGPAVPWKGRRHGRRQHRRWGRAWSPEQIARRLPLDSPTTPRCASATRRSPRRSTCRLVGRVRGELAPHQVARALGRRVQRVLRERTGLDRVFLQQFRVFGGTDRGEGAAMRALGAAMGVEIPADHWIADRVVSVGYFALVDAAEAAPTLDAFSDAYEWWDVRDRPPLLFDHDAIAEGALATLRAQAHYLPLGARLLPEKFTMPDLQRLYEAVLGRALDRRNFQKWVLDLGFVERLPERKTGGAHRAPYMYRFAPAAATSAAAGAPVRGRA